MPPKDASEEFSKMLQGLVDLMGVSSVVTGNAEAPVKASPELKATLMSQVVSGLLADPTRKYSNSGYVDKAEDIVKDILARSGLS